MSDKLIRHTFNLVSGYKLKLWEKLMLGFAKPHYVENAAYVVMWKSIFDRFYIMDMKSKDYMRIDRQSDGGLNNPWVN